MQGIGLYIRRLSKSRHGTPAKAARRAADHGVNHVAIMGGWQQPRKNGKVRVGAPNKDKLADYADAFRSMGISVGLWFYPWAGHEDQMLDVLHTQSEGNGIAYWLNDAELGYKWKRTLSKSAAAGQSGTNMRGVQPEAIKGGMPDGTARWQKKYAKKLQEGMLAAKSSGLISQVGFTSYGLAKWHLNFPWEQFCDRVDFASPQLYTATPTQVDKGLSMWASFFGGRAPLCSPSVGTFGPKSRAKMHDHLSSFVDCEVAIEGFMAWSWMQTDSSEWDVLARWADWLSRGACSLEVGQW